jgi:hypothetical protein
VSNGDIRDIMECPLQCLLPSEYNFNMRFSVGAKMIATDDVRLIIPLSLKYIMRNVHILITEFQACKRNGYRNKYGFTILSENCKRNCFYIKRNYLSNAK